MSDKHSSSPYYSKTNIHFTRARRKYVVLPHMLQHTLPTHTCFNIHSLPIHFKVPVQSTSNHKTKAFSRNNSLVTAQYVHPVFEPFSKVLHDM